MSQKIDWKIFTVSVLAGVGAYLAVNLTTGCQHHPQILMPPPVFTPPPTVALGKPDTESDKELDPDPVTSRSACMMGIGKTGDPAKELEEMDNILSQKESSE